MSIATEKPITLKEVASRFGVQVRTVQSWIRRDRNPLQAWRVGGTVLTTESAIEAFAEPLTSSSAHIQKELNIATSADRRRCEENSRKLKAMLGRK